MLVHSINALILMTPSMYVKFLLVLLRYKTVNINLLWKVNFVRNIDLGFLIVFLKTGPFCKVKRYFLYVIFSFVTCSKIFLAMQT